MAPSRLILADPDPIWVKPVFLKGIRGQVINHCSLMSLKNLQIIVHF